MRRCTTATDRYRHKGEGWTHRRRMGPVHFNTPRRRGLGTLVTATLMIAGGLRAQPRLIGPARAADYPVQERAAETGSRWALLISGISGDSERKEVFYKRIMELRSVLEDSLGYPQDHVVVMFEDPNRDPGRIQFKSTREDLAKASGDIARRTRPSDTLLVFVMGHGTSDKSGYKLNLVGPDPTAEDLASAVYGIPAGSYVVVNTTSASGASVPALSRDKSVVVAATKSGNEKNETRMADFLIEALKDKSADLDKNGRTSVLEAFSYASRKLEESYAKEGALQTEHPVLEDDGDGQAQGNPGPANGEGFLARTTYLDAAPSVSARTAGGEEEKALALEADALERQIEELRYAKGTMPQEEYEKKLEELLLKLAEVHAKLRKK
jgi:hypothetical protein